jgi:osmoprotectant transport system substrate-binding protein
MQTFHRRHGRRALAALLAVPLALGVAACGSSNDSVAGSGGGSGAKVTIVGQKFTEADILTQLYKGLLDKAGFSTSVKNLGARSVYLKPLEKDQVQVSADYLSSMTEELNRQANGENAPSVATSDVQQTLAKLNALAKGVGLVALQPAQAQDANAYAVTKAFAQKNHVTTLSDLGKLGRPVSLAANSDCKERPDCGKGLTSVYGIKLSKIEPLGFGSPQTKQAAVKGEVDVAQVGTTDASLSSLGLVILTDDKKWQHAENLVPIVNATWLAKNPKARAALDKLSSVLTTEDLTSLIDKVDNQRQQAADVAQAYLKEKGLI